MVRNGIAKGIVNNFKNYFYLCDNLLKLVMEKFPISMNEPILVTGSAGFIGAALVKRLLTEGLNVIGIDNFNEYYDVNLKIARNKSINKTSSKSSGKWKLYQCSLEDKKKINDIFSNEKPEIVVNLAAQAGVRYSIKNPDAYISSNIVGFSNILEECRNNEIRNFIYASSSSVYGGNKKLPFKESDPVNHPISVYAATKRSNELMAHTYSHLFNIPSTGLRFFTVYGPWGRPDMAPFIFAKAIFEEKKMSINNFGNMMRDFTYIDDIVEALYRCCLKPATLDLDFNDLNPDSSTSKSPHRIFNIGNSQPVKLMDFIDILESKINKKAIKEFKSLDPGDVVSTSSDTKLLEEWIGFAPKTSVEDGVEEFIKWYKSFYEIN